MTRRFRLFWLVLLVCSASTTAEAQSICSGNTLTAGVQSGRWRARSDAAASWSIRSCWSRYCGSALANRYSDPYSLLFQHQGDGRLAGWRMLCGYPYEAFELSPSRCGT